MRFLAVIFLIALPVYAEDGGFTLFQDYHCPDAAPMEQIDGGWVATEERKERIDCGLAGAQGELDVWRGNKQQPLPDPGFAWSTQHTIYTVILGLISAEIAIISNRAGRNCKSVLNPFHGC